MTTVAEIIAAAAQLTPDEFLELRRELNRLELRIWDHDVVERPVELDDEEESETN